MGYRSEVSIMCENKAFQMLKEAWERVDLNPDIVYAVERNDLPNDYIIKWEWVKWYKDYEDVGEIEEVLSELNEKKYQSETGYAFKQIIIGEDNYTEEYSNERGYDELDDFYVACYVEMPDGKIIFRGR